jgi:hypothetical protein
MLALACNALGDDARGDELLIQFRAMLALAPGVGISKGAGSSGCSSRGRRLAPKSCAVRSLCAIGSRLPLSITLR